MAAWRDSLPEQSDVITYQRVSNIIRTDMEVGVPKMRLRSTKARVEVTIGAMVFTRKQVDEFDNFWDVDLGGGVLPFDWDHPISDAGATFRFTARPSFAMVGGGDTDSRSYMADLSLEIL